MNLRFAFALFALICSAQEHQHETKTSTLKGTVESIDFGAKRIGVANEAIPGGMGAMTMSYAVDDEQVLNRVKPGDRITATMKDGEVKLYGITVMSSTPAAVEEGMRLEELEKIALTSNPTAAQADARARASASLVLQAGLYPNPTVGYYGDEIRGGSYAGGKQGGYISQTIVTAGKLGAARRVAGAMAAEAKTGAELQRQRILTNVRMLFYQVLAAQRLVEVREKLVNLAQDSVLTSHQLANIGQADRPDVLQSEVEQQQAGINLRIAQQYLVAAWRMLAAVAGRPELPLTHLVGDLEAIPEINYEQWLSTTLSESPEVRLAQQGVERAEALVIQAKRSPIPNLEVNANLSQDNEPLDSPRRAVGLVGGVQVGVQLPIFNHNQGNISAAKDEAEIARQELARTKLRITRDLAGRFREYDAGRVTVQQYKTEMLPRAEKAYELYRISYQKMAAAYSQQLMSQRTLFQLEADYVRALDMAWQAVLEIRGFGLNDGLAMPAR